LGVKLIVWFPTLFFIHNFYKYSNGPCKPILDIYIPKTFKWYKEFFNPMGFDPCNRFLKIQESIETPTPKISLTWECGVHSLTLSHTFTSIKCDSQASLLAHTFISPCFGHKPKAKVATYVLYLKIITRLKNL